MPVSGNTSLPRGTNRSWWYVMGPGPQCPSKNTGRLSRLLNAGSILHACNRNWFVLIQVHVRLILAITSDRRRSASDYQPHVYCAGL
jgi:hypothetical protein